MPKHRVKMAAKPDSIAETPFRAERELQSEERAKSKTGKMLCVSNLPYQATDVLLEAWFRASGVTLQTIKISRDRVSGPAGAFAFVRIADKHHSGWVTTGCDGEYFLGRRLTIREFCPLLEAV